MKKLKLKIFRLLLSYMKKEPFRVRSNGPGKDVLWKKGRKNSSETVPLMQGSLARNRCVLWFREIAHKILALQAVEKLVKTTQPFKALVNRKKPCDCPTRIPWCTSLNLPNQSGMPAGGKIMFPPIRTIDGKLLNIPLLSGLSTVRGHGGECPTNQDYCLYAEDSVLPIRAIDDVQMNLPD